MTTDKIWANSTGHGASYSGPGGALFPHVPARPTDSVPQ